MIAASLTKESELDTKWENKKETHEKDAQKEKPLTTAIDRNMQYSS